MPLYLYECSCGNKTEAFNRMDDRHTAAPVCGRNATHGQMPLKITPVLGYVQRDCHYICPVTRKEVTSNRQRQNIMREHDLVDANDFKPEAMFAAAEKQKEQDAALIRDLKKDWPMAESELQTLLPALPTLETT